MIMVKDTAIVAGSFCRYTAESGLVMLALSFVVCDPTRGRD